MKTIQILSLKPNLPYNDVHLIFEEIEHIHWLILIGRVQSYRFFQISICINLHFYHFILL